MTRRRRTAPPAPRAWIYAVPLPTTRRQRRPGAAPPAPRTRAPAGSTPLPSDSRNKLQTLKDGQVTCQIAN
uniref:Uncharacterized protein n=1 Tax=Oryza rufipogon TaxID=4529 RepID=A0A0E0MW06_ORYRU